MKHNPTAAQEAATFKRSPVAIACSLVLVAMAGEVYAQATEQVIVSGIRKGIEDAISVKKNSDNIVEAISAEDIGKLPDTTIAESISRLPGVAAQRDKATGKASAVSVRGLSPDFNGVLLNGREQVSNGDSRGVLLDQYPAELISQVLVYKTPDAGLIGQGLASTIDNRTVNPLNFSKRTVAANYRTVKSSIGAGDGIPEGKGNRISLSYIDQYADRTVGLALGFTRLDDKGGGQAKFNSWGGWTPETEINGSKYKAIGGFTSDVEQRNEKRDGAMAVLQFKPNKNFETTFDVFYSKGEVTLKKTGLEGAIWGGAGPYDPDGKLSNATLVNGVVQAGTYSNYKAVVRNHLEAKNDDLLALGLNSKARLADWTLNGDVSMSKVNNVFNRFETTAGLAGNANKGGAVDSISYTGFNGSNFSSVVYKPGLNYADRNVAFLTDVDGWSGGESSPQAGYLAHPVVKDKMSSFRFSAAKSVNLGPLANVEFGANLSERDKTRSTEEGRLVIKGGDPYGKVAVPGTATAVAGITGIQVVSFDPRGSLGTIYDLAQKVDADIFNKSWAVNEKVNTFFVKSDLSGDLAGLSYRGNVGVQLATTKQHATGVNVSTTTCTGNTIATCPTSNIGAGTSYNDFLPSLNLSFDLKGDQVMRFGAGQTLSRANMGDMRASTTFSYDQTKKIYSGSGGNPYLEPFRAKALDLSYEKYFGKKGYVSVAGFYKDLDTYILKAGKQFDFKPLLGNAAVPAGASTLGIMTTPLNGSGGTIKGIELAVNVPFSLATSALDGFGISVNHSDTSSSINLATAGFNTQDIGISTIPLPGLSKRVTNYRFYYENYGFQIAVAARQRSDFLGEISDYQDNRQLTFIKAETTVDLQLGYEFNSGMLKGLSINLQGSNLTNTKFQRYDGDPSKIVETIKYGKTYTAGLNYKF
jgi:iron complex outermembrane recepter protein